MSNLCDCDCIGHSRHLSAGARRSTTVFVRCVRRYFFIGMQIADTDRSRFDIDSAALGSVGVVDFRCPVVRQLMPLSRRYAPLVRCCRRRVPLQSRIAAEHATLSTPSLTFIARSQSILFGAYTELLPSCLPMYTWWLNLCELRYSCHLSNAKPSASFGLSPFTARCT